jgi:hypothetical protein
MTTLYFILAIGRPDRLLQLQRHFSQPGEPAWPTFIVFAILAALLLLLLVIANAGASRSGRPTGRNANRLFRDLLGGLGLSFSDKRLLRRIARRLRLVNPAVMLLSPTLLGGHAYRWADLAGGEPSRRAGLARLDTVCRRLFDQSLPHPDLPAAAGELPQVDHGQA